VPQAIYPRYPCKGLRRVGQLAVLEQLEDVFHGNNSSETWNEKAAGVTNPRRERH
jgi:hypothetical protein